VGVELFQKFEVGVAQAGSLDLEKELVGLRFRDRLGGVEFKGIRSGELHCLGCGGD